MQRIYVDTSVLGGYFDVEFEDETRRFFRRIFDGELDVFISEITELELLLAPQPIQDLLKKIPPLRAHRLEFTEEAQALAHMYLKEKILERASINDAYHIAIATVNRIDVVV